MPPYYCHDQATLLIGDAVEQLRTLPERSVDAVVSSPPYYFQRDYGVEGQYGLEATPQEYLDTLRLVFREVRRVLADDGTLWLNLGDAYSQRKAVRLSSHQEGLHGARGARPSWRESRAAGRARMSRENLIDGQAVTEKSLMMLPERLAIGMCEDGWILRNKIVWAMTATTPDPTRDRIPGKWEPVLLFSKSARYHFDTSTPGTDSDVWRFPASSGAGSHTASYPLELPLRCIRAGCKPGGTVLDPFSGSGTTGEAALQLGREYIGIDLNPAYHELAKDRFARRALTP
ncbi:site-specific DNA-methyltransferase [Streptomyces griseoluteus]|uniref:DNA-methyltransferase n=1 Tax=Streptomyces griseoluteus TaxID=29306 RepID=UPI0033BFE129